MDSYEVEGIARREAEQVASSLRSDLEYQVEDAKRETGYLEGRVNGKIETVENRIENISCRLDDISDRLATLADLLNELRKIGS